LFVFDSKSTKCSRPKKESILTGSVQVVAISVRKLSEIPGNLFDSWGSLKKTRNKPDLFQRVLSPDSVLTGPVPQLANLFAPLLN